jgi:succinate-semialdehyde dehydrogenase/glutarate-semialdehyde dehydrogenase
VPDGVINVVPTLKNVVEVGKEMCESKIVKKVTFTGSTPVAKLLYKMAASTLKKSVSSLYPTNTTSYETTRPGSPSKLVEMRRSSCSTMPTLTRPLRVCHDFTHDRVCFSTSTLAAVLCKFRGSGQTCVCANRIYVQSSVYADFASRLAAKVSAFKIGNGLDEGV